MKKTKGVLKKNLIGFIIGIITGGSISVIAATYFPSNDVTYDNSVSGLQSTNVQGAIDELYQVCTYEPTGGEQILENVDVVTSGDGLYEDEYEDGRYIYRGANPNNYITFNDETAGWRIISIEKDGSIKIVKEATIIGSRAYDTASGRYQGSSGYCNSASGGCNIWGSSSTLYDVSGNPITTLPRVIGGTAYTLPTAENSLNTHLNGTYYNDTLSSTARGQIEESWFNVGPVSDSSSYNLKQNIEQSKAVRWEGNVGLIDIIEYVKASTNSACDSVYDFRSNSSCYDNPQNYLDISYCSWTLSPYSYLDKISNSYSYFGFNVDEAGHVNYKTSNLSCGARPAISLKTDIKLSGSGTKSDPYTIE